MTTGAHLFADPAQAAQYALNRPRYPAELYQLLLDASAGRALAVDVATGSGQAAVDLAEHFHRIIALDGSEAQLAHAAARPNIEYRHADAHTTGLPDACADLVTVAQALHWFDLPRFYHEARRILRPGSGVLAAWTYALPILLAPGQQQPGRPQELLVRLYESLDCHWDPRRRLVDSGYKGIEPQPGTDFATVSRHELSTSKVVTVEEVVGYVSSWSAYRSLVREQPAGAADPLVAFRAELMAALGAQGGDSSTTELTMVTPISLVLCTGPLIRE